jgi:hypothetical protein
VSDPAPRTAYRLGYNLEERPAVRILATVRRRLRSAGPVSATRLSLQYLVGRAAYRSVHRERRFTVGATQLPYLDTPNHTERAVEVPWARDFAAQLPPDASLLEVGNVLNRFHPFPHVVLDKYEVAPGIINEDVTRFTPGRPFALIVSISTLEHVGFDEEPRSPGRFLAAVHHLRDVCLSRGGRLVLTLPLGYNPEVDEWVNSGTEGLGECHILERYSALNLWREVPPPHGPAGRSRDQFDRRYPGASVVAFWSYRAPDR